MPVIPQEEPTVGAQLLGLTTGRDRAANHPHDDVDFTDPELAAYYQRGVAMGAQLPVSPVRPAASGPNELLSQLRNALGEPLTGHDLYAWQSDMETGRDIHVVEREAFARAEFAMDRRRLEQAERDLADGRYWTTPVELSQETDPSEPPTPAAAIDDSDAFNDWLVGTVDSTRAASASGRPARTAASAAAAFPHPPLTWPPAPSAGTSPTASGPQPHAGRSTRRSR